MKRYLYVFLDGKVVAKHAIVKERTVLGRDTDADIVLPHPGVSGRHARIVALRDEIFIEDLKSTNGTTVNGKQIRKWRLAEGDYFNIAVYAFRLSSQPESCA